MSKIEQMKDAEERMRRAREVAIPAVELELARAISLHPKFNSAHEGYAVLKEETDELWDEVKLRNHDKNRMKKEAVQVAAMAIRFITDITLEEGKAIREPAN